MRRLILAFTLCLFTLLVNSQPKHLPIVVNNLWGYIKTDGTLALKPQYAWASNFYDKYAIVKLDNKYALLDANFQLITPFAYDSIKPLSPEYVGVATDSLFSLFHITQKRVLASGYDNIVPYFNNFKVYLNGTCGLITNAGKLIIAPVYQRIKVFYSKADTLLYLVQSNNKVGLLDAKQRTFLPAEYEEISFANDTIIQFKKKGLYGYMLLNGKILTPARWKDIEFVDAQLVKFTKKDSCMLMNRLTGKCLVTPFDNILYEEDNYLYVNDNKKIGVIDWSGNVVLSPKYESFKLLTPTTFLVGNQYYYGLVKPYDSLIVPITYDNIELVKPMNEKNSKVNFFLLKSNGKVGLVDEWGNFIVAPDYQDVKPMTDKLFRVQRNNKYGLIDNKNRVLLTPEYTRISVKHGLIIAKNDTYYALINNDTIISPFINDRIVVSDGIAKLYRGKGVEILDFDSKGKVIDKYWYDDVPSIEVGIYENTVNTGSSKTKDIRYAWSFDQTAGKWGLYDDVSAKYFIAPKYDQVISDKPLDKISGRYPIDNISTTSYTTEVYDCCTSFDLNEFKFITNRRYGTVIDGDNGSLYEKKKPMSFSVSEEEILFPFNSAGEFIIKDTKSEKYFSYKYTIKNNDPVFCSNSEAMNMLMNDSTNYFIKSTRWGINSSLSFYDVVDNAYLLSNKYHYANWRQTDFLFVDGAKVSFDCYLKGLDYCFLSIWNIKPFVNQYDTVIVVHSAMRIPGLLNSQGKLTIPFFYDELGAISQNRISVRIGNLWGYSDLQGDTIVAAIYKEVRPFNYGVAPVKKEEKWGAIDTMGNMIIPLEYDEMETFIGGISIVKNDQKFGLIDSTAKFILPLQYDLIRPFVDGIALVKDKRCFYIKSDGSALNNEKYNYAYDFENGYAIVKIGQKYGVINKRGEWVLQPEHQQIHSVGANKTAIIGVKKKFMVYSLETGKPLVVTKFKEKPRIESSGLIRFTTKELHGFIDKQGVTVSPAIYPSTTSFSEGFAFVKTSVFWRLIDSDGKYVTEDGYRSVAPFKNGIAKVQMRDNSVAYIDTTGNIFFFVSENRNLYDYNGQTGIVKADTIKYFIDNKGDRMLTTIFDDIKPFVGSIAPVRVKDSWGLIDRTGKLIVEPMYSGIEIYPNGFIKVYTSKGCGLADKNMRIIVKPIYDEVVPVAPGIFRVKLGGKLSYIKKNGSYLWN